MERPFGGPLGSGDLGDLLRRELKIGEQASVLDTEHIHPGRIPGGHIDAVLYQKFPDGRVYPIGKSHLDPNTLEEIK
jgi:hypothetical protein